MTNEEMIKSMPTEELANFICKNIECYECPGKNFCYLAECNANGLQTWLKKEVDENEINERDEAPRKVEAEK